MKSKAPEHTTIRNQSLFCLNCGGEQKLIFPITITEMVKKTAQFNKLHEKCPKTWVEPEPSPELPIYERAMFWMNYGETGLSSKTIWNCMMRNTKYPVNNPHDPSDFNRCYKLLKQIPEWRKRLNELKPLSKEWAALVDNWEKLEKMLIEKNPLETSNFMYEFMQSILK